MNSHLKKIWFPGHMAHAKKKLSTLLKGCDLILEIRDARAPLASSQISKDYKFKSVAIICNKKQLADSTATKEWLYYFKKNQQMVFFYNFLNKSDIRKIIVLLKKKAAIKKLSQKSVIKIPFRVLIVGVPNTGKSTLINSILGKKRVKVGAVPGITRYLEWVKASDDLEILDSPGVLLPSASDLERNLILPLIYSTKNESLSLAPSVYFLLDIFSNKPTIDFLSRYKLSQEILPCKPYVLLELIKNNLNVHSKTLTGANTKTQQIIVNDFRNGYLGNITLEKPPADTESLYSLKIVS